MKAFACGDVVPGCTATFSAPDEDGILALVGAHAHADHGIATPTPELIAAVGAAIRTV
jgi:predicted small metal-binding protein